MTSGDEVAVLFLISKVSPAEIYPALDKINF